MLSWGLSTFTTKVCYRLLATSSFMILLSACTAERNYRGVPAPSWQELTGEQKQLIVDQAYEQEFKE